MQADASCNEDHNRFVHSKRREQKSQCDAARSKLSGHSQDLQAATVITDLSGPAVRGQAATRFKRQHADQGVASIAFQRIPTCQALSGYWHPCLRYVTRFSSCTASSSLSVPVLSPASMLMEVWVISLQEAHVAVTQQAGSIANVGHRLCHTANWMYLNQEQSVLEMLSDVQDYMNQLDMRCLRSAASGYTEVPIVPLVGRSTK
jgi:hypothetical protein